jgi:hypothetical protein
MATNLGQSDAQKAQNRSDMNRIVTNQVSMQYDPNRVNDPNYMYMGGLQQQQIQHQGVYNQIQPPVVVNRYIIERPVVQLPHKEPEYYKRKELKTKPVVKKPVVKEKDTWNTLFGD